MIEGIFFSSVLLGVRDTIDQLQVPTIVANAAANALSRDRKSNYIYRTSYSNYQLGVPLGPWAMRTIGKSGVAAITANYAAGQESAAAFKDAYEKAGGTLNDDDPHAVPDDAGLPALPPAGRGRRREGRLGVHRRRRRGDQVRQDLQAVRLRQAVPALRQQQHDRPAERARLRGRRRARHPDDGELGADAEEQGERALPQAVRRRSVSAPRRPSPSSATSRRSSSTSPCARCTATRATSSASSTRWRASAPGSRPAAS